MPKIYKKYTCHGPLPRVTHNDLKCGKNEDPAKITYSKMAFFSRLCGALDCEATHIH